MCAQCRVVFEHDNPEFIPIRYGKWQVLCRRLTEINGVIGDVAVESVDFQAREAGGGPAVGADGIVIARHQRKTDLAGPQLPRRETAIGVICKYDSVAICR